MKKKRTAKKKSASSQRRANRDIEKGYPLSQFIDKLRRFADALETGKRFSIQIHRERIHVPARAIAIIEHEREGDEEEIEFQLKWRNTATPAPQGSTSARQQRRN